MRSTFEDRFDGDIYSDIAEGEIVMPSQVIVFSQ